MKMQQRCIVIGGGIVGLATASALQDAYPWVQVVVLEKEVDVAFHQSGRNSGVLHSGIYYKPGSLKAKMAVAGSRSMVEFCQRHAITFDLCGKIIVATVTAELAGLKNLYQRGTENGIKVAWLNESEVREIEPNVDCLAAVRVPGAGIVDYLAVCRQLVTNIRSRGGEVIFSQRVVKLDERNSRVRVITDTQEYEGILCIACAGLQCDRIAKLSSVDPGMRVVPFKGEYFELSENRQDIVNGLVYPVPDPRFPFLGVHLTKMVGGGVHAGPNAVLSLKREGYGKFELDARDIMSIVSFGGFWKFAARHYKEGINEMLRSFSKRRFVASLQRLVPSIEAKDLVPSPCGIRAQALAYDGSLVDDFRIIRSGRAVHVCNAPSPAATASLEIGKYIATEVSDLLGSVRQVG